MARGGRGSKTGSIHQRSYADAFGAGTFGKLRGSYKTATKQMKLGKSYGVTSGARFTRVTHPTAGTADVRVREPGHIQTETRARKIKSAAYRQFSGRSARPLSGF